MTASKIVAAAASGVGGAGLDVDEVFSTDLWVGTGSDVVVTTGIDLQNEGGIVWVKNRGRSSTDHTIWTRNDQTGWLKPNTTAAITNQNWIRDWTTTTYTAAGNSTNYASYSGDDYVGWTFRKAPNFFDCVQFNSNSGSHGITTHSHNLGVNPALIIIKPTSRTGSWYVFHQNASNNSSTSYRNYLRLNATDAEANAGAEIISANTTQFTYNSGMTEHSETHIAYLFAHHANDGSATGFGPNGDSPVISCGSYTASNSGVSINLGFEPQWVIIKRTDSSQSWYIFDTMRGFTASDNPVTLKPDSSDAEGGLAKYRITSTGFQWNSDSGDSGRQYIFMAIRRGSLFPPTDATKVFAVQDGRGASKLYTAGFPVDAFLQGNKNGDNWQLHSRLTRGKVLATDTNAAETDDTFYYFDDQTGIVKSDGTGSALTQLVAYMWKRAPSYFDCVGFSGTGSARTVPHGLTVPVEMMWVKRRNAASDWKVYHSALGNTKHLNLNETIAAATDSSIWNNTTPTASVFTLGYDIKVNGNNDTYIAYLFASSNVSKVGSYTGNGSTQNIDCGFSSGARFVLIKRSSGTDDWYVFDTVRGYVSGSGDAALKLNSTAAESSLNMIDPHASGFSLRAAAWYNGDYIFYAIA